MVWTGVVNSRYARDNYAGSLEAEVTYEANGTSLQDETLMQFPPPLINNRPAEIFLVERLRQESKIPNFKLYALSRDEHQPPSQKSRVEGSPGSFIGLKSAAVLQAEDVGDALRGEIRKRQLAPGLKVPENVSKVFSIFHLHLYHDRISNGEARTAIALQWRDDVADFIMTHGIIFHSDVKRGAFFAARNAITSWLEHSPNDLLSKESWVTPFTLTNQLMSLVACARGGYNEERTAMISMEKALNSGSIDYSVIFYSIKSSDDSSKNFRGGYRGAGRGRGANRGAYRGGGRGGRGQRGGRGSLLIPDEG